MKFLSASDNIYINYVLRFFNCKCPCRLIKDEKGQYTVKEEHRHAPLPAQVERSKILNNIKEKAKTDKIGARSLIADAIQGTCSQVSAQLPSISQISRTVNRVRNKGNISKVSKNSNTIELTEEFTITAKGDKFLLFDNENIEDRLLLFATKENLRILKLCDEISCDGTFDIVPNMFQQLYTIHGEF